MHIEELKGEGEPESGETRGSVHDGAGAATNAKKRAVVGVGARVLFYPTLLYNLLRNKIQPEFHWWDEVDEFLLLGAVPFPTDVPHLKQLGVRGVITMNEPYETLVPTSLYLAHGIENLVLPTRDYLFAPSLGDICKAVDFIHKNASCGRTTYVHCKAGRGRSTTIVLCYLVQHRHMTPTAAYEYVRLSRPRVLLATSQWQAVQEFYHLRVMKIGMSSCLDGPLVKMPAFLTTRKLMSFDDSSFVVISESDLDGYSEDENHGVGNSMWAEVGLVYRVQFAGRAALARVSCFWLRCHTSHETIVPKSIRNESCSLEADKLGSGHPCLLRGVVVNL
uniref:phosphatidylglycerophosphatase n=1 Tax=Anthurium amnicola TaxID=1678845 RepID=A0A1D1Z0L8_9ARAE